MAIVRRCSRFGFARAAITQHRAAGGSDLHRKVNKQLRARPLIGQPAYAVSPEVVDSAFFGKPLKWQKVRRVFGTLSFGVVFEFTYSAGK